MDNASIHNTAAIDAFFQSRPSFYKVNMPRYSPMLDMMEEVFSNLKASLTTLRPSTEVICLLLLLLLLLLLMFVCVCVCVCVCV